MASLEGEQVILWIADDAGNDDQVTGFLGSLYDQVKLFKHPDRALEFVRTNENSPIIVSILISGSFGSQLVPEHLQTSKCVKNIYVFCYDVKKHREWAKNCDKVRSVQGDIGKILSNMEEDLYRKPSKVPAKAPNDDVEPIEIEEKPVFVERFSTNKNFYDQLALQLIFDGPDNEGRDDFRLFCQNNQEKHIDHLEKSLEDGKEISDWFQGDFTFIHITVNDLENIWNLRWLLRFFHRQMVDECGEFVKKEKKFEVFYGTSLTNDEFELMKTNLGESITLNKFIIGSKRHEEALALAKDKVDEKYKHPVVFEIKVDLKTKKTVPFTEIQHDQILFWFGSRHRVMRTELVETDDPKETYWLITLTLIPTLDPNPLVQELYEYYLRTLKNLDDLHHAFGQIFILKGSFYQAMHWLEKTKHYEDLTHLALRLCRYEQVEEYLKHLPEDSDRANLLRVQFYILSSNNTLAKGQALVTEIIGLTDDKLVRARAMIIQGFLRLTINQQAEETLNELKISNKILAKEMPEIHPELVRSSIAIGYAHFALNQIEEAEEIFRTALKKQKMSLTHLHPDFARTHSALAHCFAQTKNKRRQAIEELIDARDILLLAFPKEQKFHPEILATNHDIDSIQNGKKLRPRNILSDYI